MADVSGVEQGFVDRISVVLYPLGASFPSMTGATCRIYRGWPNASTLNSDLSAGRVNVTVTPDNDTAKTTTRYLPHWHTADTVPTLAANVLAQTITIGGTPSVGDVIGTLIDTATYIYRVEQGDTPDQVAANLCAAIATDRTAILVGRSIDVPGANKISVRIVHDAAASCEARRQEKDLRVICWCATPAMRDTVSTAIDASLAEISFLALSDTTTARIVYRNTKIFDQSENALLYRRDLVYSVEYPTIITVNSPTLLFGAAAINGQINYG